MSDDSNRSIYLLQLEIGLGVFWFVWTVKGFWWGLAYGLFWEMWVGWHLAAWLLGAAK